MLIKIKNIKNNHQKKKKKKTLRLSVSRYGFSALTIRMLLKFYFYIRAIGSLSFSSFQKGISRKQDEVQFHP